MIFPVKIRTGTDLAGEPFGRLTAIRVVRKDSKRQHYWLCRCMCSPNRTVVVRADKLRQGRVESCGCYRVESNRIAMKIKQALGVITRRPLVPRTA